MGQGVREDRVWVTHAGRCGACFTMEARCTGCVRVRGCEGVAECGMRWLGRRVVGQIGQEGEWEKVHDSADMRGRERMRSTGILGTQTGVTNARGREDE